MLISILLDILYILDYSDFPASHNSDFPKFPWFLA